MGLDMFIFKIKRCDTATLDDVSAVEGYIDWKEYKKEHPEYKGNMKAWCGYDRPPQKYIDFYSPLCTTDKYGFKHIAEEVAYWRKANAIHQWFVDNVQNGEDNCGTYRELTITDLMRLRNLAQKVHDDPDLAEDLLPTQHGFFFGSTEYDEWYMDKIDNTIEQIDRILETTDFNTEALYYSSSW